ncbi:MAG: GNAT family N-acetyltransferase [Bacteroidia bacterium]|nr:GNAT family N-acetyltransferase [Bacteroidia bacterium]
MFAICDKIIQKNKLKPHRKLFGNYTFSCFEDMELIPKANWDAAIKDHNTFLSFSYLHILHQQRTEHFRFRYVIVYNHQKPIGVVYFQINDFSASLFGELIAHQISELQSKRASVFKKYIQHSEDETIMRLVTCGNNFISGEHGFYLDVNSRKIKFKLLEGVIDAVAREEKLRGKISAILVKDFYEEGFGDKDCWYCNRFIHFNVEPNMIIHLPEGVNSLTDYINRFSKKYRNRAKSILKASSTLTKKRLTTEEIIAHNDELYELYMHVFRQAKFKLAHLSENYFADVVKAETNLFYVDAWYQGDQMVSFASGFYLPTEIEAHYIGFDYAINKEYELYQTILYSYIEEAIAAKKQSINLGRTASEIKTTVGAKAHELICYIKPQNTVSKLILKPFMQFLQPTEWVPRNPFKDE